MIAGGGSVFATPAGGEWLTLLEALEQPHRSTRVRSAALTCFFGHTAADLDARGDDLTDEVAETLRTWLELFGSRGLAAVMEAASIAGLPARVLAEVGGDRRLTDLRHIGEALHEVALTERHGLVSLLTWLREQVGEGRAGRGLERTRRLDSDAAAVQLVTIHASKGLEYPVVYLPAVSDRHVSEPDLPRFHDDARPALPQRRRRRRGLVRPRPPGPGGGRRRVAAPAVRRPHPRPVPGRLLVVADQEHPRLAAAPDADAGGRLRRGPRPAAGPVRRRRGRALRAVARPRRSGSRARDPARAGRRRPRSTEVPVLGVRAFTRTVDAAWRRTSYSSLSAVRAETVVDAVDQRAGGGRQGRRETLSTRRVS